MSFADFKDGWVALVESNLKDRASPGNLKVILSRIEKMNANSASVDQTMDRIRIAVKLFIDETLADDLYESLKSTTEFIEEYKN